MRETNLSDIRRVGSNALVSNLNAQFLGGYTASQIWDKRYAAKPSEPTWLRLGSIGNIVNTIISIGCNWENGVSSWSTIQYSGTVDTFSSVPFTLDFAVLYKSPKGTLAVDKLRIVKDSDKYYMEAHYQLPRENTLFVYDIANLNTGLARLVIAPKQEDAEVIQEFDIVSAPSFHDFVTKNEISAITTNQTPMDMQVTDNQSRMGGGEINNSD